MKVPATLFFLAFAQLCLAETPHAIQQRYAAEAGSAYAVSAKRGEALFRLQAGHNDRMPSCTACHTGNPANNGQHAITGKTIRPLALVANPERFNDPGKVEKWFGRNCREVLGRECSPGEKADFIAFMSEFRP